MIERSKRIQAIRVQIDNTQTSGFSCVYLALKYNLDRVNLIIKNYYEIMRC